VETKGQHIRTEQPNMKYCLPDRLKTADQVCWDWVSYHSIKTFHVLYRSLCMVFTWILHDTAYYTEDLSRWKSGAEAAAH